MTERLASGGAGSSVTTSGLWLPAGATLHVGLAAVGWAPGSRMKVTLTSHDAPLAAGRPVVGRTVEAVDFVDEARRFGTSVRVGGARVVGHETDAARTWYPAGTGLLVLDAVAEGNASARLTVTLPQDRLHRGEDLHEERIGVVAFQGGGAFEVRLGAVREPGAGLDRWGGASSDLQARALYADLSVPLRALHAWHDPIAVEDDDW